MTKTIDVDQKFKSIDGQNLMVADPKSGAEACVALRTILVNSLLDPKAEDAASTGEDKLTRWNLAQSIFNAKKSVELDDADIKRLKTSVNKCYPTVIVGQAYQMLDGK